MNTIIDASDKPLGRVATRAAKQALLGDTVVVINSSKAVISGTYQNVYLKYRQKYSRGVPSKGPFFPRSPAKIMRRTIRGMLPYKQEKGMKAFKKVRCFDSAPENIKENFKIEAKISGPYVTLQRICEGLGGR